MSSPAYGAVKLFFVAFLGLVLAGDVALAYGMIQTLLS